MLVEIVILYCFFFITEILTLLYVLCTYGHGVWSSVETWVETVLAYCPNHPAYKMNLWLDFSKNG